MPKNGEAVQMTILRAKREVDGYIQSDWRCFNEGSGI